MIFPKLVFGQFLHRDNRFRATVNVNGQKAWAHVPNSGRLSDLFIPRTPIWLAPAENPSRKTAFDLKLVEHGPVLVSVDARLPNPLFAEALIAKKLPDFDYANIDPEVYLNDSRIDFRLSGPNEVCWVETKSVTLVVEGIAKFPDAPTSRGRRHLLELIRARARGNRAAVVFIIQRPDAFGFGPHQEADPEFAVALEHAIQAGVEVRAFTCRVTLESICVVREIPVEIS
jgi:sugar fermentation stimulation protein A